MTLKEIYAARLESAQQASSRSRWVFAAITTGALAQIGASFNTYGSWVRRFGLEKDWPEKQPVLTELRQYLLRAWVDSTFVSVPLIGVKLSIADASLIGSVALTIMALWFFFCMRRENHMLAAILRDIIIKDEAAHSNPLLVQYVIYGVRSTQVFATVSANDAPVSSYRDKPVFRPSGTSRFIRRVVPALMYLPALSIGVVLLCDFLSLVFFDAMFQVDHKPLGMEKLFTWHAAVFFGVGLVCLYLSGHLAHQTARYQRATAELMAESRQDLEATELKLKVKLNEKSGDAEATRRLADAVTALVVGAVEVSKQGNPLNLVSGGQPESPKTSEFIK